MFCSVLGAARASIGGVVLGAVETRAQCQWFCAGAPGNGGSVSVELGVIGSLLSAARARGSGVGVSVPGTAGVGNLSSVALCWILLEPGPSQLYSFHI